MYGGPHLQQPRAKGWPVLVSIDVPKPEYRRDGTA